MKRQSSESASSPNKRQTTLSALGTLQASFVFPRLTGISQKIVDRSSIFQGFFVPFTDASQIGPFLKMFKESPMCQKVDHTMTAWQFEDQETGRQSGFDDDGERFSGTKLEKFLKDLDIIGLVVVIREYGGVMLGPIRFQHIVQCAREAFMVFKSNRSKDTAEVDRIKRQLAARDRTVELLRDKLRERQSQTEGMDVLSQSTQVSIAASQSSNKEYSQSLIVLQRLLLARDKTIDALRAKLNTPT